MPHAPARHRFTVEEYFEMGRAGVLPGDMRTELLDGEVVEMAPIGSAHASTVTRLSHALFQLCGADTWIWTQNPVELSTYSVPQPDIAVLIEQPDAAVSATWPSADRRRAAESGCRTTSESAGKEGLAMASHRRLPRLAVPLLAVLIAATVAGCGPPSYPAPWGTPLAGGRANPAASEVAQSSAEPAGAEAYPGTREGTPDAESYPGPRQGASGPVEGLDGSVLISTMMLPDTEAPSGPGHTFGAQLQRYDLDTRDLAPLPAVGNGLSFGGGMAPDGSLLAQWSMAREALTHTLAFATEELGEVDVLPETSFQLEVAGLVSPAQAVVVPASPSYGALEMGLVWDGPDRFWYLDPGGDPGYRSPGVTNPPSGVADLHRVQVTRDGASLTAVDEVAAQVDLGAMGDGGHATLISANDAAGRASIAFYAVDEFITEFSNPKLVVVDLASGAAVQEMPLAEVTPPDGLAASPNGRWVAALNAGQGNEGHYVRIVDLERFESRDIPSADVVGGPLVWSNGAWLGWRTADGWALADASDANRQTIHWRQPHDMSVPVTPDGSASGGNAGQLVNHEMVALAPDAPIALIRAGVVGQEGPLGGQAGKFYFEDLGTGNTEFIEEFDDLDPTVLAWLR